MNGPLELVLVTFDGDPHEGLVHAFDKVRWQGSVRIVDLVFLVVSSSGQVIVREVADLDDAQVGRLGVVDAASAGELAMGWFSKDDLRAIAGDVAPGATGVLILLEHTWVADLLDTAAEVGGVITTNGRIAGDVARQVEGLIGRGSPNGVYLAQEAGVRRAAMVRRVGRDLLERATFIPVVLPADRR